jgi:hypothetical protein
MKVKMAGSGGGCQRPQCSEETDAMNEPMVKIAGLYEKTSQKGNRYFIGRLNGARLLMFANTDKKQESDPDWLLYVQERSEQLSEKKER